MRTEDQKDPHVGDGTITIMQEHERMSVPIDYCTKGIQLLSKQTVSLSLLGVLLYAKSALSLGLNQFFN